VSYMALNEKLCNYSDLGRMCGKVGMVYLNVHSVLTFC
jgi:hypothetical protein